MSKARIIPGESGNPPNVVFYCPGCKGNHAVPYTRQEPPPQTPCLWFFDENIESPTIKPSLKILTRHDGPASCHVVITAGVLHYCGDCQHPLANQAIPMQDCHLIGEDEEPAKT